MDSKPIKRQIKNLLSEGVYDLLKECNAMLVGGALTSILTKREVNDFDIYFKSREDLLKAVADVKNHQFLEQYELIFIGSTDKSATFRMNGSEIKVQFIQQEYYPDVVSVFNDFDFTINMIGYDFKQDKIYYNKTALQHLSQRILVVNAKTKFPLVSVLRVEKYRKRGYEISKKEMVKLLIALCKLEMKSYDDIRKHVGGMYGVNVLDLLDTTKPFSVDDVIDQLNSLDMDAMDKAVFAAYNSDLDRYICDVLLGIDASKLPYIKTVLNTENPNIFRSWWDNTFTYELGKEVIPKLKANFIVDNSGIHCAKTFGGLVYSGHPDRATTILVEPLNTNETESPFRDGVRFVKTLPQVVDQASWIEWLIEDGYVTEEAGKEMELFTINDASLNL